MVVTKRITTGGTKSLRSTEGANYCIDARRMSDDEVADATTEESAIDLQMSAPEHPTTYDRVSSRSIFRPIIAA